MTRRPSVQAHATTRNALVELFIDVILREFALLLQSNSRIIRFDGPYLGVEIESDDCRDVFDHKLVLFENSTVNSIPIEIWAQTTCYKGHTTAIRESNKTYEIRETLIEALGLRRLLKSRNDRFLTLHFTVGPSSYTYQWFEDLKAASFDLSVYIPHPDSGPSLYEILAELAVGCSNDFDIQESFRNALTSHATLSETTRTVTNQLIAWFEREDRQNSNADAQSTLLQELREAHLGEAQDLIGNGVLKGAGIKSQAIKLLEGENTSDAILRETVKRLITSNPFLSYAIDVQSRWKEWIQQFDPSILVKSDLTSYLKCLWTASSPDHLILRRILLRANSGDSNFYPADLNINGLTEHNIYSGAHTDEQIAQVVRILIDRYAILGIRDCESFFSRFSEIGSQVLRSSQRLESVNGTNLKPSFYYIEEFLKPELNLVKFNQLDLDPPVGYHADFTDSRVEPYENLKVVVHPESNRPLAILKAKYFRQQEFARRAKEEAFVGLTLMHRYNHGKFVRKYSNLPLVMFIDCEPNCRPHSHSLTRLITVGWTIFFCPIQMKSFFLERL